MAGFVVPYAPSTTYQPNGRLVDLIRLAGEQQAQFAQRQGDISAQLYGGIGNNIANIAGGIQKNIADAPQRQLQQIQVAQAQQGQQDKSALDAAFAPTPGSTLQPGDSGPVQPATPKTREDILNALPGHLRPTVAKQFTDADEAAAKVQETSLKATDAQNNYLGGLGAAIRDNGYSHVATTLAIQHAKETYANNPPMLQQIGMIEQKIAQNPDQLPVIVNTLIKGSKDQQAADAAAATASARGVTAQTGIDRLNLEKPKIAAETQKAVAEVEGTLPMSPAQQAQNAVALQGLGVRKAELGIAQQRNSREQSTFNQTQGDGASSTAQLIADYKLPTPAARSLASAGGQALMQKVLELNPDFDATQYPNRQKTRQAFTTGTQGQQLNAMNTAIGHLDQMRGAIMALNNGDVQIANSAKNWLNTQLGGNAATNFDTLKVAVSDEIASVLKKSGATDASIKDVQSTINAKNSPEQLAGYIQTQIPIMGSKLSSLNYQYHQAMGENDPFQALSPDAKTVLTKYGFDPSHPTVAATPGAGASAAAPMTRTIRNTKTGETKLQTSTDGGLTWK